MERTEDCNDVVGLFLVFVRVVVAGSALDAAREPELRDIPLRLFGNRRQVDRDACRADFSIAANTPQSSAAKSAALP